MLVIRRAEAGDVRAVAALLEAHIREQLARFPDAYPRLIPHTAAAQWATTWHARAVRGDPDSFVWLAADRAPVGLLAGEVWTRPVGEPAVVFFAEWFYVEPMHRHSGVGLALERALVAACRARGIGHVEARSLAGDTQWLDRGWHLTSMQSVRPLEALAGDLERAARREESVA